MPTGVLNTKLYKPSRRSNAVLRLRLLEKLDDGAEEGVRLTLVSAPAGSGKTTLLGEWSASRKFPTAWLSLDDSDNDLVRFWTYVIAALQTIRSDLGQGVLEVLQSAQPAAIQLWLPDLLNEVADLPDTLVLVLDDYHVISAAGIHESAAFLLDHLPPCLHLVVSTRADPPLPLARLRARDQMVEVRAADLRFTEEEALSFLSQTMALNLPSGAVESLLNRTEGWAVGLQLAGLSLQGQADPQRYIESFSGGHHYVLEYLVDEVLSRQPEQVQRFLTRTAILEQLSGPLCDAVADETNSAALLADLFRSNLFLVPLDDEHLWYRYHHLFRDLLRARLEQLSPDLIPMLHRRAAEWFAEHGFSAQAVQHALAAQDYVRAADLIEQYAPSRWALSDTAFLTTIGKLPLELVQSRPGLAIHHAFALVLLGQHQAAQTILHGMMPHIPAEPNPEMKGIASFAAVLLAYIVELMGEEARVELPDPQSLQYVPEHRLAMRNTADVTYAFLLHFRGEFDPAAELLLGAVQRDEAAHGTTAIPVAISRLGRIRIVQGRLREAAALCREYLQQVEARGQRQFYIGGSLNLVLGDVLREWNDLDSAEREIRHGIEMNQAWPSPESHAIGYFLLARVLLAEGDPKGALDALQQVDRTIQGHLISPDISSDIQGFRVRLWLAEGNLKAASQWSEQRSWSVPLDFRHERDQITRARVLLAQSKAVEAHALMDRMKRAAEQGGRVGRRIEIGLLDALALEALQERSQALEELGRCLALAEPEGYRRMFLDEGERMQSLLQLCKSKVRGSQPMEEYLARLLAAFPPLETPTQAQPSNPANPSRDLLGLQSLVEPLTPRELEVLRLVCEGHTYRVIAERLVITTSAVKKHMGNVLGKLGVTSRAQAMVKARQLGLFQEDT